VNFPDPGRRKGESKEEGMRRRKKEGDRKSHKLWLEIQKVEAEKKAAALRLIEERIGDYEDRPL